MSVTLSEILHVRDSRAPFHDFLDSLPRTECEETALKSLPVFTVVGEDSAESFACKLRSAVSSCDADLLLALVRDSFSEFRYEDFSQLEGHYKDVLAVMGGLLSGFMEMESVSPGKVEWILGSEGGYMHICFNLRGSAEDAVGKLTFGSPASSVRIGVSFSAFDRTIDRWCLI